MKVLKRIILISLLNLASLGGTVYLARVMPQSPAAAQQVVEEVHPTPVSSLNPSPVRMIKTRVATVPFKKIRTPTTKTITTNPTPQPANRCIVMVDGGKYDVTEFRKIHQGGDIFQCGTDMTRIFYSQHDATTFAKLQKYRVQ